MMTDLLTLSPSMLVDYLKECGITAFHLVFDDAKQKIVASHRELQSLAEFINNDTRDFQQHEGLFFQIDNTQDTLQGAFVHRTVRGQAAGGVRYFSYATVADYLRDGLRLSKGMTRKNALAGIWWGGGKGVIAHNPKVDHFDPTIRTTIYREYGRLMSRIQGCYVTAEDAGTCEADMANVFLQTRFTTCIPKTLGGSGNPSISTAKGIVCGMEAALAFLDKGDLAGKTIAIQGVGNVGSPLIGFLLQKNVKKIIACDVQQHIIEQAQQLYADQPVELSLVEKGDNSILAVDCDVVAPCSIGGTLNPITIPTIKALIVCGAANNQLEDVQHDDALLFSKGVTYVPDFLVNRMGIVNCANEQYGFLADDPEITKHFDQQWQYSIYQTSLRVLKKSKQQKTATASIAMTLADEMSIQAHPIFGHRGRLIINALMANKWFEE